ncbi:MAG: M15 family metallopeptidase [Paludibacter sp.]|nr:M15 family metallopeptidase [Paludibacter sp.]
MKKYYFLLVFIVVVLTSCNDNNKNKTVQSAENVQDTVIVDCNYTFEEAIINSRAPKNTLEQLVLIEVTYYSTDNKLHRGQLLLNKKIADDVAQIFEFIKEQKFPVQSVIPIVKYGWNDELSMENNNTSAFCYRNKSYSFHADGLAIDINPRQNPAVYKFKQRIEPKNGNYEPSQAGTLSAKHPIVLKFKEFGFRWGGNFSQKYDYQHFEKGTPKISSRPKNDTITKN